MFFIGGTVTCRITYGSFFLFLFNIIYLTKHKWIKYWYLLLLPFIPFLIWSYYPIFTNNSIMWTDHYDSLHRALDGRLSVWQLYWNIFSKSVIPGVIAGPITGFGIGFVDNYSRFTTIPSAHSIHNEFFQFLLEFGIIGASLLIWFIYDFCKQTPINYSSKILKCILLCFLLNATVNPVVHTWIFTVYITIIYGLFLVNQKEKEDA